MLVTAAVIEWGDLATWVAALGTVSAVAVALVQVYRERKVRRVRETTDRYERHRAQARLISAWTGPADLAPEALIGTSSRTPIYLNNSSPEPVYEIVVGLVFLQGAAPHSIEDQLKVRSQSEADPRGWPCSAIPVTTRISDYTGLTTSRPPRRSPR